MEAKDGSAGFDFEGTYTKVVPRKLIEYRMGDDREVKVEFIEGADGVLVKETFDAETVYDPEMQRQGWQAILDNFARHVEAKATPGKNSSNEVKIVAELKAVRSGIPGTSYVILDPP